MSQGWWRKGGTRQAAGVRPAVEALEDRTLLSAAPLLDINRTTPLDALHLLQELKRDAG